MRSGKPTGQEEDPMVAQCEVSGSPFEMEAGASVVERARSGDRAAYGELVRRFRPAVYAVVLAWLHDPNEADDVAQEVFIHSMRKLAQLRDVRCFAGWLRQIAVRLSLNRLNRRHPFGTAGPSRLPQVMASGAAPLDELIDAEERGRVRDGLGQLKPLDRAVLEAFYLRGLSLREISEEFDVPLGTVKRRLHTARQRLKEQLAPGG
jgi:RNA polymerase sigma-70 factor (ECF subfamily)